MPAPSERGSIGELVSGAGQGWLGNSIWESPEIEISRIKSWPSITAMSYHRDGGEATWRGDRPRLILARDQRPPMVLQVDQGRTWQTPLAAPGTLSFCPIGLTIRTVQSAARHVQVVWDPDLYSALLPEFGAAAPRFEFHVALQDPLLGQIVTPWPRRSKAALQTGFWQKAWARPCVFASPAILSGISGCRSAGGFRGSGCSGCATTSKRISRTISRSPSSPTSRV